jgi:hypothetical protein
VFVNNGRSEFARAPYDCLSEPEEEFCYMASTRLPKQDPGNATAPEQPASPPATKPPTAGQQVALTIKLLVVAAVLIGLIWLIDRGV